MIKLLKRLQEFDSPETLWLRAHPVRFGIYGGLVASAFLIPTAVLIYKERRK